MNGSKKRLGNGCGLFCLIIAAAVPVLGQSAAITAKTEAVTDAPVDARVEAKIDALSTSLEETRGELAESREEIRQLRAMLERVSQQLNATGGPSGRVERLRPQHRLRKKWRSARPRCLRPQRAHRRISNRRVHKRRVFRRTIGTC